MPDAFPREALFDGNGEGLPQSEIDRLKRVRLDRQAILTQPKPPKVRAIIHETALRMPIGGAAVMHEQLSHLARDSKTGDHGRVLQASPTAFEALLDTLKQNV